jgi:hypothetical protein
MIVTSAQYQRPRPYQPNPPNKNITTTMINSVFVSMAMLSNFFGAIRDRLFVAAVLR